MTDKNPSNEKNSIQNERSGSKTEILITEQFSTQNKKQSEISYCQILQKQLYQKIILPSQEQKDQSSKIRQKLSEDIRYKLQQTQKEISKTKKIQRQHLLQLQIKQHAFNKVLVNTYGFCEYRLIISIFHLGKAYLNLKCYQQAKDHIQQCLLKNAKYSETKATQLYESLMLTSLGQAYFNLQMQEKAIQKLTKSIQIQEKQQNQEKKSINILKSYHFLSKSFLQANKFGQALKFANLALQKSTSLKKTHYTEYFQALHNKGQILLESQKTQQKLQGLKLYKQIIEQITQMFPDNQQSLIQLHSQLAEYYLKQNKNDEYLKSLLNKYKVLENAYGYRDKRCIKQKRHYATSLLKMEKFQDAQNQLQDILEIQGVVFGPISLQVAKTLKLLGSLNISKKELKTAQNYLKKSEKIFHDQGYPILQRQVKSKLTQLAQNQSSDK